MNNVDEEKVMKMAKKAVIQGYAAKLPMLIVKNVVEAFGNKGWEVLEKAAKEFANYRTPMLKPLVGDSENARNLGQVFDFEDSLSGIKGNWEEHGTREAVKKEEKCIPSEIYKEFPDYCGRFLWIIANETIKMINQRAEVTPFNEVKCIAYGDGYCEIKVRIIE